MQVRVRASIHMVNPRHMQYASAGGDLFIAPVSESFIHVYLPHCYFLGLGGNQ